MSSVPRVVGLLLILALVLRLAVAFGLDGQRLGTDAADYQRHAVSIAAGDGFPDSVLTADGGPSALRAPAYPFFLGGVFAVSGDSLTAARIVQALLGVLAVALIGWIAARAFGRRAGVAALALGAVYPPLVLATGAVMTEALFVPLALGAIAAALWARDDPGARGRLALVGALAGLAVLTRVSGVVVVLAALLIVGTGAARGSRLARVGIVAVVAVLVVAPWTIRNAVVTDAFVPVGLEEGLQLSGIMSDEARTNGELPGAWFPPNFARRYAALFERPGLSEPQLDHELRSSALEYARDHAGYALKVPLWNTQRMLHLGPEVFERRAAEDWSVPYWGHQAGRWAFYALGALAVAGLLVARRRVPAWMWLTPVLFFALGAISAGFIRYRHPADLFLLMLAGAGLAAIGVGRTRTAGMPSGSAR